MGRHVIVTRPSYNLSVPSSTPIRALSLWLVSLLMGLLALGPFLHAHYGVAIATGFHVNGLQAVAISPWPALSTEQATLSLPSEQESPAVGVVTSLPRAEVDAFSTDTPSVALLGFLLLSVAPRMPSAWLWAPANNPIMARIFQAGCPPPAHAPPSLP